MTREVTPGAHGVLVLQLLEQLLAGAYSLLGVMVEQSSVAQTWMTTLPQPWPPPTSRCASAARSSG